MLAELRERHPIALRQRVVGRRDEHEVLLEQRLGGELEIVDGQVDDGEVEVPGLQLERERRRARLDHDGAHAGVLDPQPVEQARHEPAGGGADDAEAHVAAQLGAEARDVGPDRVELGLDAPRPGHHRGAFLGEPAGAAVDQRGAELVLEAGDVGRDVRLHGVERLRGAGERAVLRDGDQGLELAHVHGRQSATPIAQSDDQRH